MSVRDDHEIHIQNLIEIDDDCRVVPVQVAIDLENKCRELESALQLIGTAKATGDNALKLLKAIATTALDGCK